MLKMFKKLMLVIFGAISLSYAMEDRSLRLMATLAEIKQKTYEFNVHARSNGRLTELMFCLKNPQYRAYTNNFIDQVNQRYSSGDTALMAAASTGQEEMVAYFLKSGAQVHACTKNGKTALDYAQARKKSAKDQQKYERIVVLLQHAMAEQEKLGLLAEMAEQMSVDSELNGIPGSTQEADIELGSDEEEFKLASDFWDNMNLDTAISAEDDYVVIDEQGSQLVIDGEPQELITQLKALVSVEARELSQELDDAITPLMCLAMSPQMHKMIPFFCGEQINAQTKKGMTALMIAVKELNIKAVRRLIACGADTELKNAGDMTALDIAQLTNNEKLVKEFCILADRKAMEESV